MVFTSASIASIVVLMWNDTARTLVNGALRWFDVSAGPNDSAHFDIWLVREVMWWGVVVVLAAFLFRLLRDSRVGTGRGRAAGGQIRLSVRHPAIDVLARRESHAAEYRKRRDPIAAERLLWQAHIFRHLVHLLPGETILEIGSGDGGFTRALVDYDARTEPAGGRTATKQPCSVPNVEAVAIDSLPGPIAGRRFHYVVAQNVLDRDNVSYLLEHVFALLEEGGRAIFIESNPWNPMSAARRVVSSLLGRPYVQALLSRTQLYELLSEIGFIRVSARFTDFVYPPLAPTPGMARLMRNASVLLENMPLVQSLAGRIVLHAQRPPRNVIRSAVSLCGHDILRQCRVVRDPVP